MLIPGWQHLEFLSETWQNKAVLEYLSIQDVTEKWLKNILNFTVWNAPESEWKSSVHFSCYLDQYGWIKFVTTQPAPTNFFTAMQKQMSVRCVKSWLTTFYSISYEFEFSEIINEFIISKKLSASTWIQTSVEWFW